MAGFRVTPRAREDLKQIGRYTEGRWGKAQRNTYLKDLDRRFAWLAEHPALGKHRPEVQAGYYSYPQGAHVIFYRRREGGIDIIGIPHQHMDILQYFDT